MPNTRRPLWSALATLFGLVLLLTACGGEQVADEPEPDPTVEETEQEPDADAEEVEEEPEPVGEEVTLTLGHGFPEGHHIHVEVLEPFREAVLEATGGTVDIDIIPGGALGPPDGSYENTVAGGQDVGWSLQGYTAGRFPITQIVEAPFLFDSAVDATNALWDLYEEFPEFQEEYGDVKVLALWAHDLGDLWLRDRPVETMEDMQGLTLRAPGPMQLELLEGLGASPEFLPAPELFDALDRGVLDGLMIANSGLESFNLYDVLQHGVICNCYVATQFFVMNQAAWDALSPEQQEAIDEIAGRDASLWGAESYDQQYEDALGPIQEAGIEQVDITQDAEEFERWQGVGQQVFDEWIAEREAEGVPAQQMVDRLFEITGN